MKAELIVLDRSIALEERYQGPKQSASNSLNDRKIDGVKCFLDIMASTYGPGPYGPGPLGPCGSQLAKMKKSRFLPCPYHTICRVEAVGLSISYYT